MGRAGGAAELRLSLIVNNFMKISLDNWSFSCYIITMTEEQKREERRKVENRVQRWNESVRKVQRLVEEWKRENEK